MRIQWKWQLTIIVLGGLLSAYFSFRPTYEIKHYNLGFYPYTAITQMIYTTMTDRQLIYIYGKQDQESYPERDFVVQHHFSGFDEYSIVNAVCDSNRNVVLCFAEGYFEIPVPTQKIRTRRVYSNELELQPGMIIKAY
jgi:hypothetical protein